MRIAIDLDGPSYEWDRTAQYMLRTYKGYQNLHTPSISWNWIEENVSKADWAWLWTEGVRLGLFRHGHVTAGAIVGINKLKAAGHELMVVTHRPEAALRDTINWLDHHFGAEDPYPWSNVYFLTNGEPKYNIDADILVDDYPENVYQWYLHKRDAILFSRPHNTNFEGPWDRAANWNEVVRIVDRMSRAAVYWHSQQGERVGDAVPTYEEAPRSSTGEVQADREGHVDRHAVREETT